MSAEILPFGGERSRKIARGRVWDISVALQSNLPGPMILRKRVGGAKAPLGQFVGSGCNACQAEANAHRVI
jgi:hypothetical protein